MADVKFDAVAFYRRAHRLVDAWKHHTSSEDWNNASCLFIFSSQLSDDDPQYSKNVAMQNWLFGYELTDTIVVIFQHKIVMLATSKKAELMKELESANVADKIPIQVLTFKRDKKDQDNSADNRPIFEQLREQLEGQRVGVVTKEWTAYNIKEWTKFLKEVGTEIDTVDITTGLALVMAPKDGEEMQTIRMASKISCNAMDRYAAEKLLDIVDSETSIKTSHEKLSNQVYGALELKKIKVPAEADANAVEWCYPVLVQSGGQYDLRPSAVSNKDMIHPGVIVCSLGIRYKAYCSNLARTYMIDPDKQKQANYRILLELQSHVLKLMKPGVACNAIYNQALEFVREKNPDLVQYFLKSCGFAMGLEFRDSTFTLTPKCERVLQDGMIFNLTLGFQNVPSEKAKDDRSKVYALYLADTVVVGTDGAQCLTESSKRGEKEVAYFFEDDPKEKKENKKPAQNEAVKKSNVILPHRTRQEKRVEAEVSAEARRQGHQRALAEKLQANGLKKYGSGTENKVDGEEKTVRRFESYKRWDQLPAPQTSRVQIIVDNRNESVILPIYGTPVPFHVNTIRNVTKQDEGEYTFLRFNFVTPGQPGARKTDGPLPNEDPTATYIRGVSYKSSDAQHFANLFKDITELKKKVTKQDQERAEMADLVEQAKLEMMRGRKPYRLPDVYIRPQPEGKRFNGDLEIHQNGIRYSNSRNDQQVDILFSNIRHLFFQPCDNELFVIIHCNLKNHIMVGKKKTRDIQFYREVSDAGFDETGNRKRRYNYGDEDEIMAEQEERKRRQQLNRDFQDFATKIREQAKSSGNSSLDVDIPMRELSFKGVSHRELVSLMPTQNCLVQLSETPWTVVDLNDLEKVHLERVQFGLKNFDMVFIYKDFSKPTTHVTSIPVGDLELVKDWLDQMDIAYTEGPVNLVWGQIMREIQANPAGFFKEGGWSFLAEKGEDGSDIESEESEYEEDSFSEEEESSSSDSESGLDEDASASDEEGSEEESGEDWDDMEEEARRADEKKEKKRKSEYDDSPRKKSKH